MLSWHYPGNPASASSKQNSLKPIAPGIQLYAGRCLHYASQLRQQISSQVAAEVARLVQKGAQATRKFAALYAGLNPRLSAADPISPKSCQLIARAPAGRRAGHDMVALLVRRPHETHCNVVRSYSSAKGVRFCSLDVWGLWVPQMIFRAVRRLVPGRPEVICCASRANRLWMSRGTLGACSSAPRRACCLNACHPWIALERDKVCIGEAG